MPLPTPNNNGQPPPSNSVELPAQAIGSASTSSKSWLSRKKLLFVPIPVLAIVFAAWFMTSYQQPEGNAATGYAWKSGPSCGDNATNVAFGQWRGAKSTISGIFADEKVEQGQRNLWWMTQFNDWEESIDISVGMIDRSASSTETLEKAATGAYEQRWRDAMRNMNKMWGKKKTIYIRPAHEMNGNWYRWSVTKQNVGAFKQAFALYARVIKEELKDKGRDAKMVLNYAADSSALTAEEIYPGGQHVDVISVNYYDHYPETVNEAQWNEKAMRMKNGGPRGIERWREFAQSKGKPMAVSEWGLRPRESAPPFSNPFFITKMNEFFRANAGTGAGQVLYESYFNCWSTTKIFPTTNVATSAERYKSLSWGIGNPTTPTPQPPVTPPVQPPADDGSIWQSGNLLNGKLAWSNVGVANGQPVANINDKKEDTRWTSTPVNNASVTIDLLKKSQRLRKVSILWAANTTKNYSLQMTDDRMTWKTVATGTTNNSGKQLITHDNLPSNATGRYLRVQVQDRWSGSVGNSIYEMGAYDSETASTPTPSPTENILAGKTFTSNLAQSTSEPNHPLAHLNDNNEKTRFISTPHNNWQLSTDLGSSVRLGKVSILWAGDTTKNYTIQMSSNGTAWTNIATGTTNNTPRQLIEHNNLSSSATGRYLRVVGADRWNSKYGNSIWEIRAYRAQ